MKTKARSFLIVLLLIFLIHPCFSQDIAWKKSSWNGYAQLRFTTDLNKAHSFEMRRMKLWVKDAPGFSDHWGYKVQTTISSSQNEKFFLQDVEAFYRKDNFNISFGQFTPRFSLQRFQSDAIIPLTERSPVIQSLVPAAGLGGRDIGIEGTFFGRNKHFQTWVGIFNGDGIKKYRFTQNGVMVTNQTALNLLNNHLHTGYSIMFRKADQLQLTSLLPDSVTFSGNEFRYNIFAKYHYKDFNIQAEYLQANLNGESAAGYYLLATLDLKKNQLVASWNEYAGLSKSATDSQIVHLGYNYLMDKDKRKIMLDNAVQIIDGAPENYMATIQFQLFFN